MTANYVENVDSNRSQSELCHKRTAVRMFC